MAQIYKVTDADYEANTLHVLKWIRDPVASNLLGYYYPKMTSEPLTHAREDEFMDAIRYATANRVAAMEFLFNYACVRGSMRLVQFLLPMRGVDSADVDRAMPLRVAAHRGRVEIVQYLLGQIPTGLTNEIHLRMVTNAVSQGHCEMVEYLLKLANEDFDVNVHVRFDDSPYEQQWTCGSLLERAIRMNQVQVASALLSHGTSGLQETPAIMRRVPSVEMAELLYSHGADVSGEAGLEAALSSIARGDSALFFYLLDRGADIRRVKYSNATPFHLALRWGCDGLMWDRDDMTECREDFITKLFACAIDVDARGFEETTALQSISTRRMRPDKKRLAKLLVDLGASTEGWDGLELIA